MYPSIEEHNKKVIALNESIEDTKKRIIALKARFADDLAELQGSLLYEQNQLADLIGNDVKLCKKGHALTIDNQKKFVQNGNLYIRCRQCAIDSNKKSRSVLKESPTKLISAPRTENVF